MKNIWRFYDEDNGISGFCLGKTEDEARYNATYYLSIQFDDIAKKPFDNIALWPVVNDDDYREDFPFALATNY